MLKELFGKERTALQIAQEQRKYYYSKQDKQYLNIIDIRNKGEQYQGQLQTEIDNYNYYGEKITVINEVILEIAKEDGNKTSIILELLVKSRNELRYPKIKDGGK